MAIVSTEAIVLRSKDHRETSKLVSLLTRRSGRIIGVLKGIRRDPRKFGSSADKFTVNDIVFYQYRDSEIHLVSQCDMKRFFGGIRDQERRITAAEYAAEMANKILPLEEPNAAVYELMLNFLEALDSGRGDISTLVHLFQIKFLALSGFRPHIDTCVVCGQGAGGRPRFSTVRGGLVCGRCLVRAPEASAVSAGVLATLQYVERNPWPACLNIRIGPVLRREMKSLLNRFLVFHLDKNINTARYL